MTESTSAGNITHICSQTPRGRITFASEFWTAILFIALFVLINFAVATRTPTVSVDEPAYTDPAANLYFGHGFTSTMWAQDRTALWVGNVPLYQFLLYGFFELFGFGFFQARALNTILAALSAFFIWGATFQHGLIRSPLLRLFCLGLMLSGATTTLMIRTIRPDATMWFVCAAVYAATSICSTSLRIVALLFFSAFLPIAGLPMLPYAGMMLGLYMIIYRLKYFGSICAIGFGILGGIASLLLAYRHYGMLDEFISIILPFTALGSTDAPHGRLYSLFHSVGFQNTENLLVSFFGWPLEFVDQKTLFDPSAVLLFAVIVFLGSKYYKSLDTIDFRKFILAILITLVIPPVMQIAGHYRSMYRWMTYIPLCILAPALLDAISRIPKARQTKKIVLGLFILAILTGIPLRTAILVSSWNARSIAPLEQVVQQLTRPSDVVVCHRKAYFAVRPYASLVFATRLPARGEFHLIKDLPKDKISFLYLMPGEFATIAPQIGGQWARIDIENIPGGSALAKTCYMMEFYRRIDAAK